MPRDRDRTEADLRQALARLVAGKPRNPDLQGLRRDGRLHVTIRNVAIEAGCSRTLIGHDGCDYPEIRKTILDAKAHVALKRELEGEHGGGGLDSQTVIERLRRKIVDVRLENGILKTRLADAVSIATDLKGRLARAELAVDSPRAKRIAARGQKAPARPARTPDQGGTVVPFPPHQ